MRKTKTEKGITLLALIITIVVLLILAIVTIGAINNSKIITNSQNAKKDYIIAQEEEQIQLALSEWQIQKNTGDKTTTFKGVMTSALEKEAIIGEDDAHDGSLTATFTKTGNVYVVSEDGTVKTESSTEISNNTELATLEKYIFGNDLNGRDLDEIIDYNVGECGAFKNSEMFSDVSIIANITEGEHEDIYINYFKYNNEIYKFKANCDYESDIWKTDKSYGIQMITVEGERVGKKVKYNNEFWTILYDDSTNGLQMISDKCFEYNNTNVVFGINDTFINWTNVNDAEFDGDAGLSNLEKAVYSYNKAIENLNKACDSIVKKNNNIVAVRSVGSNPKDKDYENTTLYESENLSKWPSSNPGIGNKKGRSTDLNYISDYDRMVVLGIKQVTGDGDNSYWMASRRVFEKTDSVYFDMYQVYSDGSLSTCTDYIFGMYMGDDEETTTGRAAALDL